MRDVLLNISLVLGVVASLAAACIDYGEGWWSSEVLGILRGLVLVCGVGIFSIGMAAVIYRYGLHGFNNEE